MNKLIISDIDGTVADLMHRVHHVRNRPKDWNTFYKEADKDLPIKPIIRLLRAMAADGYTIVMVSGRREQIRDITEAWLKRWWIPYDRLYMRSDEERRPDHEIKREVLEQIRLDYPNHEIQFVIDDRQSVVNMWRDAGLICLQCAVWEEIK